MTARPLHNVVAFNVITFSALIVVVVHLAIVWSLGVPRRLVAHGSVDAFPEQGLLRASYRANFRLLQLSSTLAVSLFRRSERHETGWRLSPEEFLTIQCKSEEVTDTFDPGFSILRRSRTASIVPFSICIMSHLLRRGEIFAIERTTTHIRPGLTV